jgi:NTP pyrophosphatase (non-canonical NTP hydrolase)
MMSRDSESAAAALNALRDACHGNAKLKGWWIGAAASLSSSEVAEKLALIHSEVSEALEEERNGKSRDMRIEDAKPEGLVVELADVIIRIFDLCGKMELDIGDAVVAKMRYNTARSFRHGGKKI